jgi:hypothetical protein
LLSLALWRNPIGEARDKGASKGVSTRGGRTRKDWAGGGQHGLGGSMGEKGPGRESSTGALCIRFTLVFLKKPKSRYVDQCCPVLVLGQFHFAHQLLDT